MVICEALTLQMLTIAGHPQGALVVLLVKIKTCRYFTQTLLLAMSSSLLNQPGYYKALTKISYRNCWPQLDYSCPHT
jgi:hypothetical protein